MSDLLLHSPSDELGTEGSKPVSRNASALPTQDLARPQRNSHLPTLDGFRGAAILLVLFCHAVQRPYEADAINSIYAGAIDRGILALARLCWSGVDMFFVLSGFLITGILYEAKGQQHFFRNFYARRTLRIFPLYYVCLIFFLLIAPRLPAVVIQGWGHFSSSKIWYTLYLSNFSQGIAEQAGRDSDNMVHVSWTLSIEEQFYLAWPLVVFLCARRGLLKACVAMIFGSMAIRIVMLCYGKYWWAMNFTPCRLDGLALGAGIALISKGPNGWSGLARHARWVGIASAFALAVLIVSMERLGYRRGIGQSPGYLVCGTLLMALMYGSLLVLAATAALGSILQRIFASRLLRTFGKYSYAIYLFHMAIIVLVANFLFDPSRLQLRGTLLPGLAVFIVLTFGLSLLAAWISWHVFEKHLLKLKRHFPSASAVQARLSSASGNRCAIPATIAGST